MKQFFNIKPILPAIVIISLVATISCDSEKEFNYNVIATHSDGIQNLDETGIDCGGSSGKICPTCTDGIQNGQETGIDCGGPECGECTTPRANRLRERKLPYYFTFESEKKESGLELIPKETQSVNPYYGIEDPSGNGDAVTKIVRPENGSDRYADFKFKPFSGAINFLEYHKWTAKVLIPKGQDFSDPNGEGLAPRVDLILHDNGPNFWERWTVISQVINESDFGTWVTLYFDGTNAAALGTGVLLPKQKEYNNITLRFGGSNHTKGGIFYIKDFLPTKSFDVNESPRADLLANTDLPYYYTFETGDTRAGLKLEPAHTKPDGTFYNQGVKMTYGATDPAGSIDRVGKAVRPDGNVFYKNADFKFQYWITPIDFSVYHKFKIEVYIPSGNNYSTGGLQPQIDLLFHDNGPNFWDRWTVISHTVSPSDFDKWITIEYDGTDVTGSNGTKLPEQTTYNNFTIRFGGYDHEVGGTFYIKSFKPIE